MTTNQLIEGECHPFDHQPAWGGDGYFCESCMTRFISDPAHKEIVSSALAADRKNLIEKIEGMKIKRIVISRTDERFNEGLSAIISLLQEETK